MKIDNQSNEITIPLNKAIEGYSIGILTYTNHAGHLTSCPVSPVKMDASGSLWFYANKSAMKLQNLRKVNLTFSNAPSGGKDHITISGHGRLWKPLVTPIGFKDGDINNLVMLEIVPETAEQWDTPNKTMTSLLPFPRATIPPVRSFGSLFRKMEKAR